MNEIVEKEKKRIEEFIKDNDLHQDKKIDYILYNLKTNETNTLISDEYGENAIEFTPVSKNTLEGYDYVAEWDYNYDYYLFNLLEADWEIGYMDINVHYGIWESINDLYPNDYDCVNGVYNYMKYCKENNITKEKIYNETGFETKDIMNFYNELPIGYVVKCGDYMGIIEEDNYDNPNESLVQILQIEGKDILETISLKKDNLENNIIQYIQSNYMFKKMQLDIKLIGYDDWERPVYRDKNGNLYKDINLSKDSMLLYTTYNNTFYGEPFGRVADNYEFNIVKSFNNKEKEGGER